jgi:hypothetical protein
MRPREDVVEVVGGEGEGEVEERTERVEVGAEGAVVVEGAEVDLSRRAA